jgi:hypothetical protein
MIDAILLDRIHPERIKNKTTDSSDFTDFKDDGTTPVAAIEWNRQHPPHSKIRIICIISGSIRI